MKTLHVLNGDGTSGGLAKAGLPGERLVWADVFHEGPVPCAIGTDFSRRVRAEYLAAAGHGLRDTIATRYGRLVLKSRVATAALSRTHLLLLHTSATSTNRSRS